MAKTILLVEETCPACAEAKTILDSQIKKGEIEVVEANQPKAQEIVKQIKDIKAVPECITEKDGKFSRCNIEDLLRPKASPPQMRGTR